MSAFWETKTLEEMSDEEWESLCDGCARCCMIKLQDDETEEVHYTALVCDLLDQDTCQCTAHPERHELVANCVVLTPKRAGEFPMAAKVVCLSNACRGSPTAWWHPLVSGSAQSVHQAEISVQGKVIAESEVNEEAEQDMVIRWVEM